MSSDRIEKSIVLRAPRARVWRALADAAEFGTWFGVKFEGVFRPGERIRGRITLEGYDHLTLEMDIERMEAERLFTFRWHPHAVEVDVDYSREPMTLVELRLEEAEGGTRLTVVESGFDALPLERRALAFRMNEDGWAQELRNIERHVTA